MAGCFHKESVEKRKICFEEDGETDFTDYHISADGSLQRVAAQFITADCGCAMVCGIADSGHGGQKTE